MIVYYILAGALTLAALVGLAAFAVGMWIACVGGDDDGIGAAVFGGLAVFLALIALAGVAYHEPSGPACTLRPAAVEVP